MNLSLRYHLNMYMSVCGGGNYVLGIDDYKIRVLDTTSSELCFEKFADKENKNAALNVNRKEKSMLRALSYFLCWGGKAWCMKSPGDRKNRNEVWSHRSQERWDLQCN